MKKQLLFVSFIVFFCFCAFGDAGEEEVDYLLFSPNSGNTFVDEAQAIIHLDNTAQFLKEKNLAPGQIHIYGYVADVANDIDSESLSRDRAVFVINELKKRGVSPELFADPEGLGSVHLWDATGDDRSFNRRVVIMIDGTVLTSAEVNTVEPEEVVIVDIEEEFIEEEFVEEKPSRGFPWYIIPILLAIIAAILFLLLKSRKKKPAQAAPVPVVETIETVVYLDDEIRYHAYMLHLERNGQSVDVEGDWHRAVVVISGRYEADGHQVYIADGSWWARKTLSK